MVSVPAMRTLFPLFCLALLSSFGFSAPAHAAVAASADATRSRAKQKPARPKLFGHGRRVAQRDLGKLKRGVPVQFSPHKPGPPAPKASPPITTDPAVLSLERFGASIQRSVLDMA